MILTTHTSGVLTMNDLSVGFTQWYRWNDTYHPTVLVVGHSQLAYLRTMTWSGNGAIEFEQGVAVGEIRFSGLPILKIRLLDRDYHGDEHLELL